MKTIELCVYRGEGFARVLRKSQASPTGYRSTTGALPTAEAAMDAATESTVPRGLRPDRETRMRFLDLETGELLREASQARPATAAAWC